MTPSTQPSMMPSQVPSTKPSVFPSVFPSTQPSNSPTPAPTANATITGTIFVDESICNFNNTQKKIFLNATEISLVNLACTPSATIRTCEAQISAICGNRVGNRRRLQQAAQIDYRITSVFVCDSPECTSEEDVSNANTITESLSNSVSSAVQSGDLVKSLLTNPDLADIVDCLVAWGGADPSRSALVTKDAGPVVVTSDARFYPVSSCDFICRFPSERCHVLTTQDYFDWF